MSDLSYLENVTPEHGEMPSVRRGGRTAYNPVEKHYEASRQNGNETLNIVSKLTDARSVYDLFRKAANRADYGVNIRVAAINDDRTDGPVYTYAELKAAHDNGDESPVRIYFQAAPKRVTKHDEN